MITDQLVTEVILEIADEDTVSPYNNTGDFITLSPKEMMKFAKEIERRTIERCEDAASNVRVIVDGNHPYTGLKVQQEIIEAIRGLK